MATLSKKTSTKNQISTIKMADAEVKVKELDNGIKSVVLPQLTPPSYEDLRDAIRMRVVNQNTGKPIKVPKSFLDTNEWIKITDEDLYRELFSIDELFILNEFDEWAVFVRKTSKRLLKSKELSLKSKEIIKEKGKDLILYLVQKRKDIDRNPELYLDDLNLYELEALVSEMNESNKKPGSAKSGAN